LDGCCGPMKKNMLNILPLESVDDDDEDIVEEAVPG
jgi:hypothetical protein